VATDPGATPAPGTIDTVTVNTVNFVRKKP